MTARPAGGGRLEHRIARILWTGSVASILLLVAGTLLLLAAGGSPVEAGWPAFDPASLVPDLVAGRPAGLLYAGLVIAIATPLLRVAAGLVAFARVGDVRMVAVNAAVLVVVGVAVAVAGPLGR